MSKKENTAFQVNYPNNEALFDTYISMRARRTLEDEARAKERALEDITFGRFEEGQVITADDLNKLVYANRALLELIKELKDAK